METVESNPPMKISRSRPILAPLGFFLFTIGIISGGVLAYAELNAAMRNNSAELLKQEARIDRLETVYTEIAAIKRDVEWMRRYMEGRYNNRNDPPSTQYTK
jgi:hypothetical protein